jgi:hypothetical protein
MHAAFRNNLNLERRLIDRTTYKTNRSAAMAEWRTIAN